MNHPTPLPDAVLWVSMSDKNWLRDSLFRAREFDDDDYAKDWLSDVTVGECLWAQSLGEVSGLSGRTPLPPTRERWLGARKARIERFDVLYPF